VVDRHWGGMTFPVVSEWSERQGQSKDVGWNKAERQAVTMAILEAAVYINAHRENQLVRPDDRSAVCREVRVT